MVAGSHLHDFQDLHQVTLAQGSCDSPRVKIGKRLTRPGDNAMDPLQRFSAYALDFEKTFEDDDWARLEGYFAADATYTVTGTPFDCEVSGRDAIFRAIKKSIDGFDRRFDKREIVPDGPPVVDDNRVTFSGKGHYEKEGVDSLTIELSETAELDEEGRIVRLTDVYPDGQDEMLSWIERYSEDFDPSYI